jgi:hypothetical protein
VKVPSSLYGTHSIIYMDIDMDIDLDTDIVLNIDTDIVLNIDIEAHNFVLNDGCIVV